MLSAQRPPVSLNRFLVQHASTRLITVASTIDGKVRSRRQRDGVVGSSDFTVHLECTFAHLASTLRFSQHCQIAREIHHDNQWTGVSLLEHRHEVLEYAFVQFTSLRRIVSRPKDDSKICPGSHGIRVIRTDNFVPRKYSLFTQSLGARQIVHQPAVIY